MTATMVVMMISSRIFRGNITAHIKAIFHNKLFVVDGLITTVAVCIEIVTKGKDVGKAGGIGPKGVGIGTSVQSGNITLGGGNGLP